MTTSTRHRIQQAIKGQGKGSILFPGDFNAYGNTEAVKKALLRLEKQGFLVRLAQGIYLYPKVHKRLGMLYPSMDEIAKAIAKRDKARIIPTGEQALNQLGLSTQIPMKVVYLTDGSPRTIRVGKRTLKFKKTAPRNLAVKGEISGLVIHAMKALGKEGLSAEVRSRLRQLLKQEDPQTVKSDADLAPAWIRAFMLNALQKQSSS